MSSAPSSPAGTSENRSSILMGTSLAFGIFSTLLVMLRIGYRTSKRTIGASDYCILAAAAVNVAHMIVDVDSIIHWGYGRHEADLPPEIRNAPQGLLFFWLAQVLTKPSLLLTKLSLFFVYRGLFKTADTFAIRFSRLLNYFTAFIVVYYYTAAFFVTIFQCTPANKMWYPDKPGNCINKSQFFYATGIVNVITSVLLISIPLPVLLKTWHGRSEITQLLALILLGVVDTAASVVRMFTLATAAASKVDLTWTLVNSTTATAIEMSIAIIAASLVVMRPCFQAMHKAIFPHRHHTTLSGNNPSGYGGNSRYLKRDDGKDRDRDRERDNKILKTVVIEMSSQSASTQSMSTEDAINMWERF